MKNKRTYLLKKYVESCAIKVQKVFKGHYARKIKIPIKKAFKAIEPRLNGVVAGWRLRRILKTKEIQTYISQIKDFNITKSHILFNNDTNIEVKRQLELSLQQSKFNTTNKMLRLIEKMQQNALWLMYKKLEKNERSQNHLNPINIVYANSQVMKKGQGQLASSGRKHNLEQEQLEKKSLENINFNKYSIYPAQESSSQFLNADFLPGSSRSVHSRNQMAQSSISSNEKASKKTLNAYNDLPNKSFSRDSFNQSQYYLRSSTFEPNFKSDVYRQNAKTSYKRRMEYDPREQISKSRERSTQRKLS